MGEMGLKSRFFPVTRATMLDGLGDAVLRLNSLTRKLIFTIVKSFIHVDRPPPDDDGLDQDLVKCLEMGVVPLEQSNGHHSSRENETPLIKHQSSWTNGLAPEQVARYASDTFLCLWSKQCMDIRCRYHMPRISACSFLPPEAV